MDSLKASAVSKIYSAAQQNQRNVALARALEEIAVSANSSEVPSSHPNQMSLKMLSRALNMEFIGASNEATTDSNVNVAATDLRDRAYNDIMSANFFQLPAVASFTASRKSLHPRRHLDLKQAKVQQFYQSKGYSMLL